MKKTSELKKAKQQKEANQLAKMRAELKRDPLVDQNYLAFREHESRR